MCIVIDPPTLISLFKTNDPDHRKFVPLKSWIISGNGKMISGGSKFKQELLKIASILSYVQNIERAGRLVKIADESVDREAVRLKRIERSTDFDDEHLVALVSCSGSKLVATKDRRCHCYLRDSRFYGSPSHRPKIYSSGSHSNLLTQRNIAACCR